MSAKWKVARNDCVCNIAKENLKHKREIKCIPKALEQNCPNRVKAFCAPRRTQREHGEAHGELCHVSEHSELTRECAKLWPSLNWLRLTRAQDRGLQKNFPYVVLRIAKCIFANCPQKNWRGFLLLVISSSAKEEGSDVIWSTVERNQAIFFQKQESCFGFFPSKSRTKSIMNKSKGSKMQTRNPEFVSSYLCSLF